MRDWHKQDYQAPILQRAGLVEAARKGEWSRLPEILAYISSPDHDEIFAASLIRLLNPCTHASKWPVLRRATTDPSPIVRAAAAAALEPGLGHKPTLDAAWPSLWV